jgi:hypothetical protein
MMSEEERETRQQENSWTIHKHRFSREDFGVDGYAETRLPTGAEILSVQNQKGHICIWYKWDLGAKEDEVELRAFLLTGTGWEIDYEKFQLINFIGTVQIHEGDFIFHLFEVKTKKED